MAPPERRKPPIALTIAGSDSGGGAGIQADLRTFHRFGVFGTTAITAVTAQNTVGVSAWEPVESWLVRAQIDAVAADLRPAAIKTGMLGNVAIVESVAAAIREHTLTPYVLDPVMVATSGDPLLTGDAATVIRTLLIPLATLITPNIDETELLVGTKARNVFSMKAAAEVLVRQYGARAALVKGGHLEGDMMIDVLYLDGDAKVFSHPRIETSSTHGTGCTLSAAITAHLALGVPMVEAVRAGLEFVRAGLRTAPGLGGGHGPLNHWA